MGLLDKLKGHKKVRRYLFAFSVPSNSRRTSPSRASTRRQRRNMLGPILLDESPLNKAESPKSRMFPVYQDTSTRRLLPPVPCQ